jgi:hypothetical protein
MGDNGGRYIHAMPGVDLKPIGITQGWAVFAVHAPLTIHPYKLGWVSQNAYALEHPEPSAVLGDLIEAPGAFRGFNLLSLPKRRSGGVGFSVAIGV